MNKKSAVIWIFSMIISIDARSLDLFEGNQCNIHNGGSGVCKLLSKCDWLHEQLEKKEMTFRDIVQCGFSEGDEPIVCCGDTHFQSTDPTESTVRTTTHPGDLIFEQEPNDISSTTAAPTQVFPNRFSGAKIGEACQKYSKIAVPYSPPTILFGREAHLTEYPHMAALGYPNDAGGHDFKCGGTLISEQWVVTAAHCVTKKNPPTLIRMGVVWLDEDDVQPVDRTVIQKIRHESYKANLKQNDIALLQLDKPVPINDYVRPACIRTQIEDVSNTTELIIAGWGTISAEKGQQPPLLQQANVTIIPLDTCRATMKKYNMLADQPSLRNGLLDSQLCALDVTSPPNELRDACQGDSGGPIFTNQGSTGVSTIVGVVSFGVSCGTRLPSVYTRIASYTDWIESIVWPN